MTISIDDQLKAAKREIGMRERVYPRWVSAGKMRQQNADYEIAAMKAIAETLERVAAEGRLI